MCVYMHVLFGTANVECQCPSFLAFPRSTSSRRSSSAIRRRWRSRVFFILSRYSSSVIFRTPITCINRCIIVGDDSVADVCCNDESTWVVDVRSCCDIYLSLAILASFTAYCSNTQIVAAVTAPGRIAAGPAIEVVRNRFLDVYGEHRTYISILL